MIQLWAWEYKGMTQLGYEVGKITGQPRRFERFDNPTKYERLNENQVRNLRLAKVVDADAVVIDRKDYNQQRFYQVMEVFAGIKFGNPFEHEVANDIVQRLLSISYKPVTEPKGFGAVVEAGFKTFPESFRKRWVSTPTFQGTLIWNSEDCALQPWDNLIDPVVISEGQK